MAPRCAPVLALALVSQAGCLAAPVRPAVSALSRELPPARCELVGVAPSVPLSVAGVSAPIELARSAASYSIVAGTDVVEVHATRPLELAARAERASVPVHLRDRLRAHGLVVEGGVHATDLVPSESGVEATLDVDGLVQLRLAVGCNALGVGTAAAPAPGPPQDGSPTHALLGDAPLPLSASPSAPPFATVLGAEGRQFVVLEVAGARARIVRALDHGHLDGWVDAARLVPVPRGSGWEGWGSSCCGGVSGLIGRGRISPLLYEGPAILRRGARVRGEGDVVWARASEDVRVVVAVRPDPTAPVLVYEIDGVTSHGRAALPSGILVGRDDLAFPPGTVP